MLISIFFVHDWSYKYSCRYRQYCIGIDLYRTKSIHIKRRYRININFYLFPTKAVHISYRYRRYTIDIDFHINTTTTYHNLTSISNRYRLTCIQQKPSSCIVDIVYRWYCIDINWHMYTKSCQYLLSIPHRFAFVQNVIKHFEKLSHAYLKFWRIDKRNYLILQSLNAIIQTFFHCYW